MFGRGVGVSSLIHSRFHILIHCLNCAGRRVSRIRMSPLPLRPRSDSTLNAEKAAWLSSMFSSRAEQAAMEQSAAEQEPAEKAAAEEPTKEAAAAVAAGEGEPPPSTLTKPSPAPPPSTPAPRGLFSLWKEGQNDTEHELQLEAPIPLELPELTPRKERASILARFQRGGKAAADGKWASELKQCFDVAACVSPRNRKASAK